jgi:unsaturated chondroitin disaccharide hydrolase
MVKGLAAVTSALAVTLAVAASPAAAQAPDPLLATIDSNFAFAATQLNRTLAEVPSGSYPHYTRSDGTWLTRSPGWWISGFFPGSLWLMYQATGDPAWRSAAGARQAAVEPYKTSTGTHDLGFMIFNSFGQGAKLTGDPAYRQVALTAADSLSTRYSPTVRAVRSWDNSSGDAAGDFKVIVDGMMNLELLIWASRETAHGGHAGKAIEHALRTMAEHVRSDGSTHHLVVFDANTGAVRRKQTVQGYSDTSTWARGQAWALYGFTMVFRKNRDSRFLSTARRAADWYIAHLPADRVPYWDFQAPGIPNEPRDSSAAAIATSGLLELSQIDPDPVRRKQYLDAAKATLTSLSSSAYLARGTTRRSILLHGTSNKPIGEYDHGLIYGDYYFLEAMLRYRAIARNAAYQAQERGPDFNNDGYTDAVIGAPLEDDGSLQEAGQVTVLYGTATGLETRRSRQFTQTLRGSVSEEGDRFGSAFATGDFDRDGYSDLAVGAPGEDLDSSSDAGQVTIVYGTSSGLSPAKIHQFTQSSTGGAVEPGDHFGASLASGDFNDDGVVDLAYGAPDEDDGSVSDAGQVGVQYGSQYGLGSYRARAFSQSDAGGTTEAGDHFGATLASARRDADSRAELIVGAPDEDAGSVQDAGQISVIFGAAAGLDPVRNQQITQSQAGGAAEAGDRFGAALAAGRFDADAYGDVAVGAPGEDEGSVADAGQATVVYGSSDGLSGRAQPLTQSAAGGATEAGDRFGSAVAAERLDGDSYADLVAGAPDEDGAGSDSGQVSVVYGASAGLDVARNQQLTQSQVAGSAEAGDRFGASITAGLFDRDSFGDVVVGAPQEDDASLVDIGHVNVIYGGATALATGRVRAFSQGGTGGTTEPGDRFGAPLR